jgi:hypothetical protein
MSINKVRTISLYTITGAICFAAGYVACWLQFYLAYADEPPFRKADGPHMGRVEADDHAPKEP